MGLGNNMKFASHREKATLDNLGDEDRNAPVDVAQQRVGDEQPNVRLAANN